MAGVPPSARSRPLKRAFDAVEDEPVVPRKAARAHAHSSPGGAHPFVPVLRVMLPGIFHAAFALGRNLIDGVWRTLHVLGSAVTEPLDDATLDEPTLAWSADPMSAEETRSEDAGDDNDDNEAVHTYTPCGDAVDGRAPPMAHRFSPFLASLTFKRTSSEEEISYALVYTQPPPLTPALKRSPVPEMTATRPRARAHSFTGSAIEDNFAKPAPVFRRRSASFSSRGAIDVDTWRPTPGLSPRIKGPIDQPSAYPPEIFSDALLRYQWQRSRESKRSLADLRQRALKTIADNRQFVLQSRLEREAEEARKAREEAEKLLPAGPPPLSADEENEYLQCMRMSNQAMVVNAFGIKVTGEHIKRLLPGGWLNDEIVNTYMELLAERCKKDPTLPACHFFNSYFYFYLSKKGEGYDYASVRRWTLRAKVDIFAMDRVVAPIHLGVHWCLAVINMSEQRIEYYDSMGGKNPECIAILKQYLHDEHKNKKGSDIDLSGWSTYTPGALVPQQSNGYDCGVFTCQFARCRIENRPFRFSQRDMPAFRKSMVIEVKHSTLR